MIPVRVLLAEDHTLVLAAIRRLVESIEGMRVVAEAPDGRTAVSLARLHRPDLVIMDISMHELNGIEATEQIKVASPSTQVLILSSHTNGEPVRRSMKAGASGYLSKDSAPQELKMALDAVMNGEIYVSSRVARHLVADIRAARDEKTLSALDVLTLRQREILQQVVAGKSTRQIADMIGVSIKTVDAQRAEMMKRLGLQNVAGLVVFAVRHGLVNPGEGN